MINVVEFNYNWFKGGAETLPNERVFNRYFKKGESYENRNQFNGLKLTKKLGDYVRDNIGGMTFTINENVITRCTASPAIFCAVDYFYAYVDGRYGALMCGLFTLPAMYSADTDYPWIFLGVVISWNLFFLNLSFMWNFVFSRFKGAYIDKKNQTISFTWKVKGNQTKNEYGHATFPLSDLEAFASRQTKNQYGGSTHALCLAHKDHDTYKGTFLQTGVKDNLNNTNFCRLEWVLQRLSDNSLPLPDMPDLEQYRHLDPLTVEYDKKCTRSSEISKKP